MSDSRPIGIFDSGLGGLTVAKEIYKELPWESTIYIGDTARVPYGNRSPDTILKFSRQLVTFLLSENVKAIVVACATSSSTALDQLLIDFPKIPLFGVIKPATEAAINQTKTGYIGVIGTRGTINSRSFETAIEQIAISPKNHPHITKFNAIVTHSSACPLFVPIIEEGILDGPIIDAVIKHYLKNIKKQHSDTLILGCTHYPLIASKIQEFIPNVSLINMGKPLAQHLKQELSMQKLLNSRKNNVTHRYFATDVTDNFINVANLFLDTNISIEVPDISF